MTFLLIQSTCCCICSLRTGVIVISVVNFLFSLSALVLSVILSTKAIRDLETLSSNDTLAFADYATEAHFLTVSYGSHIFQSIVFMFLTTMSMILFIGVIKENPCLVMIWLFYCTIHTLALCSSFILTCINNFKAENYRIFSTAIGSLIFTAVLTWYYLSVVYSFYVEMRDGSPAASIITQPDSKCDDDNSDQRSIHSIPS